MSLHLRVVLAVLLSVTVVGCRNEPNVIVPVTDGGNLPNVPGRDGGSLPVVDGGEEPVRTETFEIRLLPVRTEGYASLPLDVADVTAGVGGVPLEITLAHERIDLATQGHAWLLGTVEVPEGTSAVDFAVRFDDAGAYENESSAGPLDARGVVVRWRSDVSTLRQRQHVVLHLDIAESVVVQGSTQRRLLPTVTVHH